MTFNIYCEGYAATGEFCPASWDGTVEAETFEEACQKLYGHLNYYDPKTNRLWGMQLFDNATDAEKFLGARATDERHRYQND
jgi:hypothetical protein